MKTFRPASASRPSDLANEWTSKGINVIAIAPGYMATENPSQTRASRNLSGHQKRAGISPIATQFEGSEILIPAAVGHVGILRFPFSQVE
jgi:NAD(P)-dependent dehydrogenase (short-subunit alcohol dehydrogenase family)